MATPKMSEEQVTQLLAAIARDIEELDKVADRARQSVRSCVTVSRESEVYAELTKAAALATYQVASLRLDLMKLAVVGK